MSIETLDDLEKAERLRIQEREEQGQADMKAVGEFSDKARQLADGIKDYDCPSHVQLWDKTRREEFKYQMALERLAQEEK